jgi:hypothetical protein
VEIDRIGLLLVDFHHVGYHRGHSGAECHVRINFCLLECLSGNQNDGTPYFFSSVPWMVSHVLFFLFLLVSNISVVMSFGFCLALLPLLSLDPALAKLVFGNGHSMLQRIPADELSCPEEHLAKMFPTSSTPGGKAMPKDDDNNNNHDGDMETGEAENETIVSTGCGLVSVS